jgi:hypothetical protein
LKPSRNPFKVSFVPAPDGTYTLDLVIQDPTGAALNIKLNIKTDICAEWVYGFQVRMNGCGNCDKYHFL